VLAEFVVVVELAAVVGLSAVVVHVVGQLAGPLNDKRLLIDKFIDVVYYSFIHFCWYKFSLINEIVMFFDI